MQRGRAEEEDEMMTKMIAPIALALVLGALPACAASRHHERGNGKVEELAYRLESAAGSSTAMLPGTGATATGASGGRCTHCSASTSGRTASWSRW